MRNVHAEQWAAIANANAARYEIIMSGGNAIAPDPARGFDKPPIWEVGISASTSEQAIDPYNIKGVHDFFRDELPKVERQPPVGDLAAATFFGAPSPISPTSLGVPPRWFFISEDERELLQVQENFLGSNWRRVTGEQPGTSFDYPGFETIFAQAERRFGRLRSEIPNFPPPITGELLYSNLIPLVWPDGTMLRISEVLSEYKPSKRRTARNFQMTFTENIDGIEPERALMNVNVSVVGMPRPDHAELLPLVRINFVGSALVRSWDELLEIVNVSHDYMRERLMSLTGERVHSMWSPR